MSDTHVVKLAVEYLERHIAGGQAADLVGMLNHVDYYGRVVMVREEVQDALNECPLAHLQRVDGRVIFTQSLGDREVTEEDLRRNIQIYRDEFRANYRKLESRDNHD
jgi:hypothetical protein